MKADKEIRLTFHNRGLRSYIEVDLCGQCPRQDDKGCCGHYSPVFYSTDLAYLAFNQPDLLDLIFIQPHLTILDASVTVNNEIDGSSYRCRFHKREGGCVLEQQERESVCRHFVCPGINWQQDPALESWQRFFEGLEDYEIALHARIAQRLEDEGLTLRNPGTRDKFFEVLRDIYAEETRVLPEFIAKQARDQEVLLLRPLSYGEEWELFYKAHK